MDDNAQLHADITKRIERDGITTVRLLLADLHGVARAKQVSADYFAGIVSSGHGWATPLLSVDLLQDYEHSRPLPMDNGVVIPDMSTFAVLPWRPTTAHVICDFFKADVPGPTSRHALRRVEAAVCAEGFSPLLGNEVEFYVYRADQPDFHSPVGAREWFTDQALGKLAPLFDDLFRYLPGLGVQVYEIFNEQGGGQVEANLLPGSPLAMVDQVFVMKAAIKEIAAMHGLRATFMTKPDNNYEVVTSGYHLHQTLLDSDGRNTFLEPGVPPAFSTTGLQYLAGQLAHAAALTAPAAQTITAYKRFRHGTYAPLDASWRHEDRGSLARVIMAGENTRIENRLGAADANPYLLAATQLAAGLDGIKSGMGAPPAEDNQPAGSGHAPLPGNLPDAARALAADTVIREAVGAHVVDEYCAMLHHVYRRFQEWVTDWEIAEYREVL
jgi:glutamine synthetase